MRVGKALTCIMAPMVLSLVSALCVDVNETLFFQNETDLKLVTTIAGCRNTTIALSWPIGNGSLLAEPIVSPTDGIQIRLTDEDVELLVSNSTHDAIDVAIRARYPCRKGSPTSFPIAASSPSNSSHLVQVFLPPNWVSYGGGSYLKRFDRSTGRLVLVWRNPDRCEAVLIPLNASGPLLRRKLNWIYIRGVIVLAAAVAAGVSGVFVLRSNRS